MIASFFQHLERHQVSWLLISGQATILYGAATFSEDIDVWVAPTFENFERFRLALRESQARYYKLTPDLTVANANAGHGFHFFFPSPEDGSEIFLDVMGVPPRVDSFEFAQASARDIPTRWGTLPTVGIQQLVELKKTQRPRDYPIISRLALTWFDERAQNYSAEDIGWVLDNMFSLPELTRLFMERPLLSAALPPATPEIVVRAAEQLRANGRIEELLEDELVDWLDARSAPLRRADRHFWRNVIESLRQLRSRGELMTEGALV